MKWGPFFDNVPRTVSYETPPPQDASGTKMFAGLVSFDGANSTILGGRRTDASSRLVVATSGAGNRLELRLKGERGAPYMMEYSEDLEKWTPLKILSNADGAGVIEDSVASSRQRFYRAVKR